MIFAKNLKTRKAFSRVISLILVHAFLLSSITLAAPQEKAPEQVFKEIVTNPDNIVIPRELGIVKSRYNADSGKLVVHIQDAHCNYEAQSNIAKILEALVKNDSLKFVAVEGADGIIDTSWFKAFPDDAVRKEVADYFMKKGEITGPEFLSITTDYPIKLFGAETRAYYLQNLNAFTSSYPLKAETEKYFNTIKAALNKLKGFIYSDELKLMDAKHAEYEAKKLQFNEYVRFLQSEAEKNRINLREYANLFKLVNVLIYEKKIDFSVTDRERTDLIDTLTKKMPKEAITLLVTQSISFKIGKISSADYYNYLRSLAASNKVDLVKNYPNLYNYIIYNSVYSKIENEKLFHDITAIETAIKEKLFQNDDQRTLERLSRHIDTLKGLVNIKLLNYEFDYYKNHKEEFANDVFTSFIHKKAAQYGLVIQIAPPVDAIAKSITKLEDFYAIAIKRDKALVDNTLAAMNRQGQKIAVLVTGGFHSEGIAKLLEKQAISYMVVCPSITKDVPTPYIQVLTNQRTSFEDIVMGAAEPAQGMLAPPSIAWAIGLNEKEVRKVYQEIHASRASPGAAEPEASLEGTFEGRVVRAKAWWMASHLTKWMERALRYAGDGIHRLAQQEDVMREAYTMALDYRLGNLVKNGALTQARADAVRERILGSREFANEFHRAFILAQSRIAPREVVVQAESDASIREKTIGEPRTNREINEAIETSEKTLVIFQNGEIPADVPPQYAQIINILRAQLNALPDGKFEEVLRNAGVPPENPLAQVFNKANLLKIFEQGYGKKKEGFTIKLVQPREVVPGVTVPGLVMNTKGSNFGHYSPEHDAAYIPWTLIDIFIDNLSDQGNDAEAYIAANIAHELAEYMVLHMAYPDGVIGLSAAKDISRQAHDIAQHLEIELAGKSDMPPSPRLGLRSALDDLLEEINTDYHSEISAKSNGAPSVEAAKESERGRIMTLIERGMVAYAGIMGSEKKDDGYSLSLENLGSVARINSIISDSILSAKEQEMVAKLVAFGKGSVFMFWEDLTDEQKRKLIDQLEMIDHEAVQKAYKTYILDRTEDASAKIVVTRNNVGMPKMADLRQESQANQAALKVGEEAYKKGAVGNLLMAGGSGARLGYTAPKIMYPASAAMRKTLGRMFGEMIAALSNEYGAPIPWDIMTSDVTDSKTQEYLKKHTDETEKLFGKLDRDRVRTDRQRIMPVFDHKGRYILGGTRDESTNDEEAKEWARYHVAVSGFGHGDARDYILRDPEVGAAKWFDEQGVRYVIANNVDNAFMIGPRALGHHILSAKGLKPGMEHMSLVVVEKTNPAESVGMVVMINDRNGVLEYSQIPEESPYLQYIYIYGMDRFILYRNDSGEVQMTSFEDFDEIFQQEIGLKGITDKKGKEEWIAQHCLPVNALPSDFRGHFMGMEYSGEMLDREARLWLRFGNINTIIWTLSTLTDKKHPLADLPVIVERGKAQDGYHPDTGEYVTKRAKKMFVDKVEIKVFDGFRKGIIHGAVILVDAQGRSLEGGFASIKNPEGKESPATARAAYVAHDVYLLERLGLGWYVSPEAIVEFSPAFAFMDGRRLRGRIGESGKIGKGSELYLSGKDTRIGNDFDIADKVKFVLKVENEENEKTQARIGDNVRVNASMAIVIHGSGQLIIDDGVIFEDSEEIDIKDGETVRIMKGLTKEERKAKIDEYAYALSEARKTSGVSGTKEKDWVAAEQAVAREFPLSNIVRMQTPGAAKAPATTPAAEVFDDGTTVNWGIWERIEGKPDMIRAKNDYTRVALKQNGVWHLGSVGAIRMNGGELTAAEHGTRGATIDAIRNEASFNGAAASLIGADRAYVLVKTKVAMTSSSDKEIIMGRPEDSSLNDAQLANLSSLMSAIQDKGVSFVVLKGLKDELKARGVAADVIFHPGITRRAIYIDEADLIHLLSLENGAELILQAIAHEKAHIDNPNLSEAEIEKIAPSYNVRLALFEDELGKLESALKGVIPAAELDNLAERVMALSQYVNVFPETLAPTIDEQVRARFNSIMVRKSVLAREVAGKLLETHQTAALAAVAQGADAMMVSFLDGQVNKGAMVKAKADSMLKSSRVFLNEWLDPANKIPPYMVQGIYRAMLEGRSADILFSFAAGWREFGTAGIRNPAMQSSFAAIQRLELEEFAVNPYAPILPGPNLIVAVTLLQQEASIALIMKDLQRRVAEGDPTLANLDPQFLRDVANNRITLAYDSRVQGDYFAKLLAAAFLKDGIQVDLFDNAAGVPHLAWAANREGSAFGILISASHSEANFHGFKVYLGFQMSQVDKVSKGMIEDARKKVGYDTMRLNLASSETDLNAILRASQGLRWIADTQVKGKDYLGKPLVPFYRWYYDLVRARSPIELLPESVKTVIKEKKASEALKVLYTAFFGVGAVPAANFPGFLSDSNYGNVDTVKAQTDVMNGMFPGHTSPDPGIVQGWVSNLVDYFTQHAGANLAGIDKAIAALNEREVGVATDPDIDRAGMMIALPQGVRGNIKAPLIAAIEKYIEQTDKIPQAAKQALTSQVTQAMRAGLNDKFLLTANDAWTFMVYWKLKMMEENGNLEKDRVYIIEKSHVTTSALERVAELYRKKGYQVYVVDTYVGFTEIGKKGRDLFAIAKLSWDAYRTIEGITGTAGFVDRAKLGEIINALKKANTELKANVPYQTAGLPIVDEMIGLLEKIQAQPSVDLAREAMGLLNALSRMHILAGVEESNGYGELGRWNREQQTVELNHISDKDGSLAAFEFLEILSYGKYVSNKTAYDMYQDLTKDIGMVCTVNSALYHPGLTGVIDKLNEIEALEKLFAYTLQQRLDRGEKVTLFNGRYTVTKVEIYRDEKYDGNFLGFAEEGIRLYVTTKAGSEVVVTYRPSGTGDSNRDYNWLLGPKPAPGADFEVYRMAIEDEMSVMVRDFFGVEGQEAGYADLPNVEFHGLLMALKEGGLQRQSEVFGKALGQGPLELTQREDNLHKAVTEYALAARKGATDTVTLAETSRVNRQAWVDYLASPEVAVASDRVPFEVNGKVIARIPRAAMIAWQAGLVDYLIGLIVSEGPTATFSISDKEIQALIGNRLPKPEAPSMAEKEKVSKPMPIKAAGKGAEASRKAEKRSARQKMYDKYVQGDERALQSTLVTISAVDENNRKPAIIAFDTGMDVEAQAAIRTGETVIEEYLGGTVVVVRGTGKALYEKLKLVSSDMANKFQREIAIVTIVGDETLTQIDSELDREAKSRKEALGKIINVAKNGKNKYVPVIVLYDVALRWAYGLNLEQVADRLSRIADPNGSHITLDDLLKGIIRIIPRIGPVNTADMVEAYRAAQQALQSL